MKGLQQQNIATSSSCKLERKTRHKYKSGFFFEYRGLLKFGISSPTLDQDQNEAYSHKEYEDEEPEDGVEIFLTGAGKILVIQFNGNRWGNSGPDLVVVVTSKTSFKEKVAPWLGIVIKCSMHATNPRPDMGLSFVELYLPHSLVSVHKANGICFWEELFNMTVYDRTTLGPTSLSWPVCNPAFADDQQGLMAANDQQHIDPELLPIRVIDIYATVSSHGGICFCKPTNWSFHTISHTWSLGVRALSIAVGKVVSNAHELYDRVFEDANFLNDNPIFDDPEVREDAPKCYTQLIAFFKLLQGEGVKAVWFDALCINQLKEDEKEREIARMGGYYEFSRGCYVLSHGVGMGSTLWALNGEKVELPPAAGKCTLLEDHYKEREFRPALPRWFQRVWTLQEFVLPQKLTFTVSGLAKMTIGRVNRLIRQGGGPSCLCMCTLPLRDPQFRYWDRGGHLCNAIEEEAILGSEQREVCKRCGHVPFIRKSDEEDVYFVDREAYCFLCQVDLGPTKHWVQHSMQNHPEFVLWILTAVAFARHGQNFLTQATTLSMLRGRQCSTQEDRVLGVLGLLRDAKGGKFQLRTGQSLRSQLWKLHKIVGQRGLLKLCLMDVAGHPEMGMSWAPTCLVNDKQLPGVSAFNFSLKGDLNVRILHSSMVLRAFDEGPVQGLFLVASILSGDLVPGEQVMPCKRVSPCHLLSKQYDAELLKVEGIFLEADDRLGGIAHNGENICGECTYHSRSCKHLIRHCKLMVHIAEGETLTFPLAAHEGGCGHRSTVRICNAATSEKGPAGAGDVSVEADFRMVLPGVATVSSLKPFSVHLIHLVTTAESVFGLVCIARSEKSDGEVFHKIGSFTCPLHLNFYPMSNRSCLIGGFGNDVSKYVCS